MERSWEEKEATTKCDGFLELQFASTSCLLALVWWCLVYERHRMPVVTLSSTQMTDGFLELNSTYSFIYGGNRLPGAQVYFKCMPAHISVIFLGWWVLEKVHCFLQHRWRIVASCTSGSCLPATVWCCLFDGLQTMPVPSLSSSVPEHIIVILAD